MTPADHLPDVLRALHAHLVTAAIAAEVHAVDVENRRAVCPVDGCLLDARVVCAGCGTLEDPELPCPVCAGMRAAA